MRKTVCCILLLVCMSIAIPACAEDVVVNGRDIAFSSETGIPYVNSDYRTMVPVRVITENLGADVSWSEPEQMVTVTTLEHTAQFFVGKDYMLVDGVKVQMDTEAVERGGRTYLPIRYVADAIDCEVMWFAYREKAIIMDRAYYSKYTEFRDMFTYKATLPEHSEFAVVNATTTKRIKYDDMKSYWNSLGSEDKEFFATMATMEYQETNPECPVSIAYIYHNKGNGKKHYLAAASTFSYDVHCFEPFKE